MTSHFFYVNWLADYGYDVLGFDYRGYGKSSGESDQEGLHKDGRAALSYALGLEQYSDKDVYVIAQSLGGAVAVPVIAAAQTSRIRAVVIDSSFYSYRAVGQSKIEQLKLFNFLSSPLSYLVSENYSPAKVKNAFNLPLLVIHGTSDAVVPYSQGKILFDALHNPKNSKQTFISIAEGQHTDGLLRPGIQKDLLNFLCLSSLNPDNCSDPHQLRANLNFKKSEP
jgi:fermentation-respiration switch protein FrsA (DUF1100 family)